MKTKQAKLDYTLIKALEDFRIDYERVIKLLMLGANVNGKDENLKTPLMIACERKETNLVNMLLKKHANINAQNIFGTTPLMYCYSCRTYANARFCNLIAKMLIDKGADVNAVDKQNRTVLDYVMQNEESQDKAEKIAFLKGYNAKTSEELEEESLIE